MPKIFLKKKIGILNKQKGSATLELLIAFAVLILNITAVMLILNGGQSMYVDSETNAEALYKAENYLEEKKVFAEQDFININTDLNDDDPTDIYSPQIAVQDLTPCKKQVTSSVSWMVPPMRSQKIEFSTLLTSISEALALGGDCPVDSPDTNWDNPERFASDTFSPGKPTAIDVLNKIIYIGSDKTPFFYIADTKEAILDQDDNLFVDFTNGFVLGATPNAVDVVRNTDSGVIKNYAFFAMNTNTNQLIVLDVTNIKQPVLVATRSLSSCVAGSYPQGWRLYVYKNALYFITRYTAGPEFHVFDISDPTNPFEIGTDTCKGFELGSTAESIEVRDQNIDGNTMRFVYLATDQDSRELRVLDVTDPFSISNISIASQNLPGIQDGQSLYIIGNKLYFGRQSTTSGADLYVFNINNPLAGLSTVGSQDIGTGVMGIKVAGSLAFLATKKVNKEFQIWNISSNPIYLVKEYNFGNVIDQGVDYENNFIYVTGQSTPNFQMLYDSSP